jgi:phage shock protein C
MDQKKIAGVCAGFARHFDMDVVLVRILWLAVIFLSGGLGIFIYLAAWLIMPKDYPVPAAHPYATAQQSTV